MSTNMPCPQRPVDRDRTIEGVVRWGRRQYGVKVDHFSRHTVWQSTPSLFRCGSTRGSDQRRLYPINVQPPALLNSRPGLSTARLRD